MIRKWISFIFNIFNKDGIVTICKEIGVDGVVPTTELSVPITAYVAEKLGLLGNAVKVAEVITNKCCAMANHKGSDRSSFSEIRSSKMYKRYREL